METPSTSVAMPPSGMPSADRPAMAELMREIIQKIQQTANVKAAFGEPISQDGVTIIPVAKVILAGGGGGGFSKAKKGDQATPEGHKEKSKGMGMGTKAMTNPVGYIKVKNGEAMYQPMVDMNKIATGGLVMGGLMMLMLIKVFGRAAK